ncbi:MAG: hypothetical protein A2Z21_01915 [Candidatus Fraserbacteria bacterium RBG_16_55_9]|uniref:Uncharacterized protein n=1 Tax=Fraserbacteria sp. (strain RBG_16_55_9) TaxID=1817864 RepID=A0A1F5UP85_FRAXR|nr:MAG: hypothetical protein A2Z21_01915 [Candidatus Fraserbacteria bacterium RBG_16_55_9]
MFDATSVVILLAYDGAVAVTITALCTEVLSTSAMPGWPGLELWSLTNWACWAQNTMVQNILKTLDLFCQN